MRAYKLLRFGVALSISLVVGADATTSAQDQGIRLLFENGTVTLVAKDVTIAAILEQWSQVGATTVLNRGSLPTTPLSVELNRVSESAALETILRGLPGYVLADRVATAPGRSQIDRIVLLGTGTTPAPQFFEPTPKPLPAPPVQASTRVRASLLPEPDEISTNGIVNIPSNNDAEASEGRGDAKAVTVPGAFPGVSGTGASVSSARPGMVAPPAGSSPGSRTTPAAMGSARPGEVAPPPTQTAPYQLPPAFVPEQ